MSDVLHDDATTPPASDGWDRSCWWSSRWCSACGWPGAARPTRSRAWPMRIRSTWPPRSPRAWPSWLKVRGRSRAARQVLFLLDSPSGSPRNSRRTAHCRCAGGGRQADGSARSEDIRAAEANWKRAKPARHWPKPPPARAEPVQRRGDDPAEARYERMPRPPVRANFRAARAQYDMALAGASRAERSRAAQGAAGAGRGGQVTAARAEVEGRAPVAGDQQAHGRPGRLVPAGYPVFTLVDIDGVGRHNPRIADAGA